MLFIYNYLLLSEYCVWLKVDKLEVVNKKWVRLKITPGTQVDTVCLIIIFCCLLH